MSVDWGALGVGHSVADGEPDRRSLFLQTPRVLVAGHGVLVPPDGVAELALCPQRILRGPYWLGILNASSFDVRRLQLGNQSLAYSLGETPGRFFQQTDDPTMPRHDRLVPIDGPAWCLGLAFVVELRNVTCVTRRANVCIWGTPVPDDGILPWVSDDVPSSRDDRAYAGYLRDREASRAHCEAARVVVPDDSWDSWQSPCDES